MKRLVRRRIVRGFINPLLAVAAACAMGGCSESIGGIANGEEASAGGVNNSHLRERAREALKLGVGYEELATVRAYAVEAMQEVGGEKMRPWIRKAVLDESPAVRFAATMALGALGDRLGRDAVGKLANAGPPSDRIASIYYAHRMGDKSRTHLLAQYLLDNGDPATRRHAAFVLGRLGEPGAIKLLARAMKDSDAGVRANAVESMAMLGSSEAESTLAGDCFGGAGAQETLGVLALGGLAKKKHRGVFIDRLAKAEHLETRLAAARALGMIGDRSGYDLAVESLDFEPRDDDDDDPAWNRRIRVREMAALALGDIGDRRALPKLSEMLESASDPRLQIAAAKAILQIL